MIIKGRAVIVAGTPGPQGPAGPTGPAGQKGDTGAQGVGLSPAAPVSLTVAFGTAYRPADTTKPYRVSVMMTLTMPSL